MLLKQQKNELLQILTDRNIFPHHVEKNDYSPLIFELKFKEGPFYFEIRPSSNSFGGEFEVRSAPTTGVPEVLGFSWRGVVNNFKIWADLMNEELDTPDLWAEATKNAQLFTGTTEAPDDKFTRHELAEVQAQLRQLQQSFAAAALPEPARQKLIELTQTAAVKAEGFSKKDWQGWFIGSLISAITSLALNPTQALDVYKLVKAVFSGLFLQ